MNEPIHTPGPWLPSLVEGLKPKKILDQSIIVGVVDGEQIAGVALMVAHGEPTPEKRLQMKANACLIAASPDLLAACEAAFERLDWYASDDKYDLGEMLHTAINKANPASTSASSPVTEIQRSRWISVTEQLPEPGFHYPVLCLVGRGGDIRTALTGAMYRLDSGWSVHDVTHWTQDGQVLQVLE